MSFGSIVQSLIRTLAVLQLLFALNTVITSTQEALLLPEHALFSLATALVIVISCGPLWIYSKELTARIIQSPGAFPTGLRLGSLCFLVLFSVPCTVESVFWVGRDYAEEMRNPFASIETSSPALAHALLAMSVVAGLLFFFAPQIVAAVSPEVAD